MTIKTISINAKCSDLCWVAAIDENEKTVIENDGYVPSFMPEEHYGDYVTLDIDVETGQILNWVKPSQADIKRDIANM